MPESRAPTARGAPPDGGLWGARPGIFSPGPPSPPGGGGVHPPAIKKPAGRKKAAPHLRKVEGGSGCQRFGGGKAAGLLPGCCWAGSPTLGPQKGPGPDPLTMFHYPKECFPTFAGMAARNPAPTMSPCASGMLARDHRWCLPATRPPMTPSAERSARRGTRYPPPPLLIARQPVVKCDHLKHLFSSVNSRRPKVLCAPKHSEERPRLLTLDGPVPFFKPTPPHPPPPPPPFSPSGIRSPGGGGLTSSTI